MAGAFGAKGAAGAVADAAVEQAQLQSASSPFSGPSIVVCGLPADVADPRPSSMLVQRHRPARTAVPCMVQGGGILLIASAAGARRCSGAIAYGLAKGAIPQFTRALGARTGRFQNPRELRFSR